MPVEITLELSSEEDAKKLLAMFHEGKLANLGVTAVERITPPASPPSQESWSKAEDERREATKQADSPPRK
ncbi:MAG: hypothetical protein LC104_01580 [Bacteroidales bacterium]|nr:hypothetical protein [Bacteroidales bacterium]